MEQKIIDNIISLLKEKVSLVVLILFGSGAQDKLKKDSDIDIAYIGKKGMDDYERFILAGEIADLVKRDVDLIDLKKASTVLASQIISKGKVLYSADEQVRVNFNIRTLKEYALLNEEREEILDKIKERGSIYG